ncbi:hypothetical protein ACFVU4_27910 [Streptomyces sp. NPDC058107]|uniref:hypothetical protein n=1 Tax=Streptomyces sp. NPDC058107 TaxID=3346343 RepID=UPI0036F03AE1
MKRRLYCASCAARLRPGTYLLCLLGCGARLCRGRNGCARQHTPNCPVRQAATGIGKAS